MKMSWKANYSKSFKNPLMQFLACKIILTNIALEFFPIIGLILTIWEINFLRAWWNDLFQEIPNGVTINFSTLKIQYIVRAYREDDDAMCADRLITFFSLIPEVFFRQFARWSSSFA